MPKPERTAAILVAAGRGLRAGAGGPKQYRSIGGQTVIFRAMAPFSAVTLQGTTPTTASGTSLCWTMGSSM